MESLLREDRIKGVHAVYILHVSLSLQQGNFPGFPIAKTMLTLLELRTALTARQLRMTFYPMTIRRDVLIHTFKDGTSHCKSTSSISLCLQTTFSKAASALNTMVLLQIYQAKLFHNTSLDLTLRCSKS